MKESSGWKRWRLLQENAHVLRVAVVIGLLIAMVVVMQWKQPFVEQIKQQALDLLGVNVDYDEVVWLDEECHPDDWEGVVIYELRDADGEVVASQEIISSCKVSCDPEGATCEDTIVPGQWLADPGAYNLFWKGGWRNLVDGRFIVTHPADLRPLEDERGFLYLGDVTIPGPTAQGVYIYLPLISHAGRTRSMLAALAVDNISRPRREWGSDYPKEDDKWQLPLISQ